MLTRSPSARMLAVAAAFIFVTFVIGMLIWTRIGGTTPLEARGYRVHVAFEQAQNLLPGSDVRVAGVKVGKVVSVTPTTGRTDAVLELRSRYAPLAQDARAILRTKTLLGETFVGLTLGTRGAPRIPEGGALSASSVAPTQQLDQVLGAFDERTRRDFRRMLEGQARMLSGRGEDLNANLAALAPTTEDLDLLLRELDHQRSDLAGIIGDTATWLHAAGARPRYLRGLLRAGSRVTEQSDRMSVQLHDTIQQLPPLQREIRRTVTVSAATARDAAPLLRTVRPAARHGARFMVQGSRLARELRLLARHLDPALRASRRGLPAYTRILDSTTPLLAGLRKASDELLPAVALFGAYRREYVATFSLLGAALQATAPTPSGERRHYVRAVIMAQPNDLAGEDLHDKRTSANRYYPYPRPGAFDDLAEGLRTWGCPSGATVDPPGSAPPCRLAAPWMFRGKTRFFPDMRLRP